MKLPQLTKYQRSKIRKNLQAIFNDTTIEQKKQGSNWYKDANNYAFEIMQATQHAFDVDVIASVISALSPRNKWERNKIDALNVINAHLNGIPQDKVKVCTFNSNKKLAFEILQGINKIKKTAKKTFSFANNILLNNDTVTIDLWHLRACFGTTIKTGLTPKAYETIQRITLEEAQKVGLKGYQYQAIIWEAIRE